MADCMILIVALVACLAGVEVHAQNNDDDDIFFPYEIKLSETDELNKVYPYVMTPLINFDMSGHCTPDKFVTVNGNVHQLKEPFSPEEEEAGYNEGVCKKLNVKVYLKDRRGYDICIIENRLRYKTYNILKDEYTSHDIFLRRRCRYQTSDQVYYAVDNHYSELYYALEHEKEPQHFQYVVLVVYDCPDPDPFLSGINSEIWNSDGVTLTLKNDGTEEHVDNLRSAGCWALGYFAMTMYKDEPMANTTSIVFNCPDEVDGFEKYVDGDYERKWRADWENDGCSPTITKTQLDKDGKLEAITATNFESEDMTITIAKPVSISSVRQAIFQRAKEFLNQRDL